MFSFLFDLSYPSLLEIFKTYKWNYQTRLLDATAGVNCACILVLFWASRFWLALLYKVIFISAGAQFYVMPRLCFLNIKNIIITNHFLYGAAWRAVVFFALSSFSGLRGNLKFLFMPQASSLCLTLYFLKQRASFTQMSCKVTQNSTVIWSVFPVSHRTRSE